MSERIAFTLHEFVAELDAYADDLLRARYGVGFRHFEVLAVLADVEPVDMTALARCLGVSKAAVSKRVPALVSEGWITATSPEGAGRSILLSLTDKGAALVRTAGAVLEDELTGILADPALAHEPIDAPRLNRQLIALTAVVQNRSAAFAAAEQEHVS